MTNDERVRRLIALAYADKRGTWHERSTEVEDAIVALVKHLDELDDYASEYVVHDRIVLT